MKVKELITILGKVDGDKKVIGTWEGIYRDVDGVYVEDDKIVLDVDGYPFATETVRDEDAKNVLYLKDM